MLNIGLDLGYGYTKAVASNGREVIFPSLVGEGFKRQYGGIFFEHRLGMNNIHIEINGRDYFVGKLATMESRNHSYAFDQNKIDHINTKVLIATSVAMLMDETDEEISIVAGLPFGDYVSQKTQMQDYLNSFNVTIKLFNGNVFTEKQIRFVAADAFPQAAGALIELAEGYSFPSSGLIGCIDVGTKTTDLNVLDPDEMLIIESMSGTINSGAHVIHSYIAREIERLTNSRPEIHELERIVRNGATIVKKGKEYSMESPLREGKADLAKRIKDEIVKKWAHKLDDLSGVYLVGGGAKLLTDDIKDIYDETIIPKAPEMLNAKGFLIVAKELIGGSWSD